MLSGKRDLREENEAIQILENTKNGKMSFQSNGSGEKNNVCYWQYALEQSFG